MYKVLIADDEETIRRGMAKLIQKDTSLEVVAEAEDGEMAYEMTKQFLPDILLVDINMPFLNGLEFIEKLEGLLKNAIIIVITGYERFEYTQAALRLRVFNYLLKPLSEDILFDCIEKAKLQLKKREIEIKHLEWARTQIEKYRSMLSSEFAENWLMGHLSEPEVEDEVDNLGLSLPKEEIGLILFHLSIASHQDADDWGEQLLFYAAENIVRDVFIDFGPLLTARAEGDNLVLISTPTPESSWLDKAEFTKDMLQRHLPVKVIMITKKAGGREDVPIVFEEILEEVEKIAQTSVLCHKMCDYIEKHYTKMDFSLKELANKMYMSPQYLSRIFKREVGVTFMDYITRLRIRRAIELLAQNDIKMYEIAEAIGYSNQHYFSSAFRKVLGVSPLEYRRKLHE